MFGKDDSSCVIGYLRCIVGMSVVVFGKCWFEFGKRFCSYIFLDVFIRIYNDFFFVVSFRISLLYLERN